MAVEAEMSRSGWVCCRNAVLTLALLPALAINADARPGGGGGGGHRGGGGEGGGHGGSFHSAPMIRSAPRIHSTPRSLSTLHSIQRHGTPRGLTADRGVRSGIAT